MAPNIIDSLYDVILDRKRTYHEGCAKGSGKGSDKGSGTGNSDDAGSDIEDSGAADSGAQVTGTAGSDSADSGASGSYTCALFKKGRDEILKKIGEEAVEVIIAAKGRDGSGRDGQGGRDRGGRDRDNCGRNSRRVVEEICDLQYHLLVLMAHEGITPDDIRRELLNRAGQSVK
jgi:phosphoribosyl-ATP pyrophosphohydrolase